jgi:hypothetical protein
VADVLHHLTPFLVFFAAAPRNATVTSQATTIINDTGAM